MGKFFGRYERNLDDRNRLQLPVKLFSDDLPSSFFALRGFDGCISIYQRKDFESLLEQLNGKSYFLRENRSFIRLALESVFELEVDAHQRITIPKDLKERHKLSQSVTVIGVIDHFEIWDKEAYESFKADSSSSYEDLAEALGGKNDGRTL